MDDVVELVNWLCLQRFNSASEKKAQSEIETALADAGYDFEREKHLSDNDIVDFFVRIGQSGIALEVKTRATPKQIYRQLERYAEHHSVDAVVLFTGTAMRLPDHIKGKPAAVASLGAGWL